MPCGSWILLFQARDVSVRYNSSLQVQVHAAATLQPSHITIGMFLPPE